MTASAKPLFRATRRKTQASVPALFDPEESRKPQEARRAQDLYPTRTIREARRQLGLTQFQLAAVMGLRGPQTVSEWERGARTPSETAVRLLRAYLDGYRPADWPSRDR
jgi:DNA-binding transcriptional regulator YiaG